jgi:hypothetical protein
MSYFINEAIFYAYTLSTSSSSSSSGFSFFHAYGRLPSLSFTEDITGCPFVIEDTSAYPFYWRCIRVSSLYRRYTQVPFLSFTKDIILCPFVIEDTSAYPFYWRCIRVSSLYRRYTRVPFLTSWINPYFLPCTVNAPEKVPYIIVASDCPWMNVYTSECFLCVMDTSGCPVLNRRHIRMFLIFSKCSVLSFSVIRSFSPPFI